MISNAANEYRQTMGSIRGSLNNLQAGGPKQQDRAQNEKT